MVPILFIAYHFPPGGGAGVQRSHKFVRYLPDQGFIPTVVTGSHAEKNRWSPEDEALANELPRDLRIFRVPGQAPKSTSQWTSRLERWFFRPTLFSRWWIQAATGAALQCVRGARLIFATMSPFETAHVAGEVSQRTGVPWIADLRDPWALDEMQVLPTWFHRRHELRKMEQLLSSASGIVMNTPEAAMAILRAFPHFRQKPLITITNGFDAADFSDDIAHRSDKKFRIVHTGYLHTDLGLKLRNQRAIYRLMGGIEGGVDILTRSHFVLLQAIERWVIQRPQVIADLEIVFAGVTSKKDRLVVSDSKIASVVRFTGYVSHAESVRLIRTADLLFLPMHNLSDGRRARIVPGKTYEYMAAGKPILAAVPEGDARDFLQKSRLGLLCKPDDVEGMIARLDQAYSAWKKNEDAINPDWEFINTFDRVKLTGDLGDFFNQILARIPDNLVGVE